MTTAKATDANPVNIEFGAFEQARLDVLETGFLLAAYETLILALKDRRLHQGHRGTLAELVSHMNRRTGTTWIGRDSIAQKIGLPVRSISNYIAELMRFGYVVAENRRTPEANNRSLRHYTLAGIDKAEIERLLAETIKSIQSKTPRDVPKVTPPRDFQSHAPAGQIVAEDDLESRPDMTKSHVGACTVTNDMELTKKRREEGPPQQSALVGFNAEPLFTDTEQSARVELARMKIGQPTDAQVLRMRSEIVGCLDRHAAEGKPGTAQGWFRSKWVSQPFFKDAIAKAAHEAPSTGNSVADTNARRTAMMFGGVQ